MNRRYRPWTHFGPDGRPWGPDAYWRCPVCQRTHKPKDFIPGAPGCHVCRPKEEASRVPPTVPAGLPSVSHGTTIVRGNAMRLGDIFKSEWLKATDFDSGPRLLTIRQVGMEPVRNPKTGDMEDRLVVRFVEEDRALITNITNANSIAKIAMSDDITDWPNKRIVCWNDPSAAFGGSTGGIRVRAPKTQKYKPPEPETLEEEGEAGF